MTLNSIRGGLISLAMGDAIGFVNELRNHKKYPHSFELKHRIVVTNWHNNTKKILVAGQYSDDTECTITLMRFLSNSKNNGKLTVDNRDELILKYIEWANSTGFVGRNMRSLLKGIKIVKGYHKRIEKLSADDKIMKRSNGALMRSWPLAFTDQWKRNAKIDCYITNPNKLCYCVEILYLKMIRMCVSSSSASSSSVFKKSKKSKRDIVNRIIEIVDDDNDNFDFGCSFSMNESRREIMAEISKYLHSEDIVTNDDQKGYVLVTFWVAIKAFINFTDYEAAIEWIVKDHPGSDTDTNAAIASSLFGTYYGLEKLIKQNGTFEKNMNLLINLDTQDSDVPRDEKYCLHDFEKLCSKFYNNACIFE